MERELDKYKFNSKIYDSIKIKIEDLLKWCNMSRY